MRFIKTAFLLSALLYTTVSLAESRPQSQNQQYKTTKTPFAIGQSGVTQKVIKRPVVTQAKKVEAQLNIPKPASLNQGYNQVKQIVQVKKHQEKTAAIAEKEKPKTNIQVQQHGDTVFDFIERSNAEENNKAGLQKPIAQKAQLAKVAPKYAPKAIPIIAPAIAKAYVKKLRKAVVVIDPGHGGKDPGATGKLGNKEKNVVLAYSRALRDELNKTGRYIVRMSRDNDTFVPLPNRVKMARKFGGDILISIHADSNPNKETRGFSIYTISKNRVDREAKKLLAQSDYEEVVRGIQLKGQSNDVKQAIIDFAQVQTKDVSDELSRIFAKNLGRKAKPLPKSNREASLAVLTAADLPSVLVELGYLSNTYEERLLATSQHRQKIVLSMVSAIDEYFKTYDYLLE